MAGALLPVLSKIDGALHALLVFARFDDAVERVWRRGRHGQTDASHVVLRQAGTDFRPVGTAVQAAMEKVWNPSHFR